MNITSEKKAIIEAKVKEFLAKTPEELHAIDEDPKYDGLFDIIDEMSECVTAVAKS